MTGDPETSAKFQANGLSHSTQAGDRDAASAPINPYRAPAYHPDADRAQDEPRGSADPGTAFWLTAAVLITLAFATPALVGGLALPLPLALMGGTFRASVVYAQQKKSDYGQVPAIVLLFTSTIVTLLLMVCCTIAFATVCTGGVLASGIEQSGFGIFIWTILSGVAALVAFALLFWQSLKWGW